MPKPATIDARLSGIISSIRSELSPILDADTARDEARAGFDAAKEGSVNAREAIMVKLSDLAAQHAWTLAEVETGAREAAKSGNAETPKALATFMGEAKLAMRPDVRGFVAGIMQLRDRAWDAEAAQAPDAPKPIKKAFQRKYHFLMTLLREAVEQRYYLTEADCIAFAVSKDPDHDSAKVHKRLAKIIGDLTMFHQDFPDGDIGACIDFLNKVTEEHLTAARNEKLGVPTPSTTVAQTAAAPKAAPKAAKAAPPAPPVVSSTIEQDIDELLNAA